MLGKTRGTLGGVALGLVALALASSCSRQAETAQPVAAAAAEAAVSDESAEVDFVLAAAQLPDSDTKLINGVAVTLASKDWPAVVLTPLKTVTPGQPPSNGRCTGTLVGYGVVVLAAHCLDRRSGGLREAYLNADGLRVKLACEVNPDYYRLPAFDAPTPRRSEDFALCFVDTPVKLPSLAAMEFERIDTRPVEKDAPVLIMGYGCTDLSVSARDTTLRIGDTKLTQAAGGNEGAYALIASRGPPQPALCPGDSGGGLFTGATTAKQTTPRRVRGVNSSVQEVPSGLLSRVSMFSHPAFVPWAQKWVAKYRDKGAYICGLPGIPEGDACRV